MLHTYKHFSKLLTLGILVFLTTQTLKADAADNVNMSSHDVHTAPKTIIVGFGLERPPFVFKDREHGIEIEMVQAICDELGYKIEPRFLPNARALKALRDKNIDLFTTVSETSKDDFYLSATYLYFNNVIFSSLEAPDIQSFSDLTGQRLTAFQRASELIAGLHDVKDDLSVYIETPSQAQQALLLYYDRVDYVLSEKRIFEFYYNQAISEGKIPGEGFPYKIHRILPTTEYSMAFTDETLRDAFDHGLAIIRSNGTYQKILDKYDKTL